MNWYGEDAEWDFIGFERVGEDSGYAWTPDGCYQAHVGMYGNFDCHVLDTDGQYHSCDGDECVDGQCRATTTSTSGKDALHTRAAFTLQKSVSLADLH